MVKGEISKTFPVEYLPGRANIEAMQVLWGGFCYFQNKIEF
jgi:hypothetical protein